MLNQILIQAHDNIVVRNTPHNFLKKIGNARHHMVQVGLRTLEEVRVYRILIERRVPRNLLPPIFISLNKLQELKSSAEPGSKNLLNLGSNNYGNYLLEVPDRPKNWDVCLKFLKWLNTETGTLAARKKEKNMKKIGTSEGGGVKPLDIYFIGDQPTTCPNCGARTKFEPVPQEDGKLIERHECLNCLYEFIMEEDPDFEEDSI